MGLFDAASFLVQIVSAIFRQGSRRNQTTGDTSTAQRKIRGEHRRPTTQLPTTYDNCTPEVLAKSIRSSGRVPLDRLKNRPWYRSAWQTTKEILLQNPTTPKSAFAVTDWQYQPNTPTSLGKRYPYSGGSMLRLRLHPHENRSHLEHSLKADKSGRIARRLVVIASVQDMFEPNSLARCVVVNSLTLQLEGDDSRAVAVWTADPLPVEGPTVYRCKQKKVPADAIWLIVPTSNYLEPSTHWEKMPKCHNEQAMPIDHTTEDADDTDAEDYVRERKLDLTAGRIAVCIYFGLIMPAVLWGSAKLTQLFGLPNAASVVWYVIFLVWCVISVSALSAVLLHQIFAAIRSRCWRRRDGQTRSTWQGRTKECLIMGTLLRNGPILDAKGLKEHYAHAFHMSDRASTGSS